MLDDLRSALDAALPRPGGPPPLGAAVGEDGLTVVVAGRRLGRGLVPREVRRRPLSAGPEGDRWPELRDALSELRTGLGLDGDARPEIHVALLPTLALTRVVDLPTADREALRKLARREADRHFLSVPDDPVADAWSLERRRGEPSPCVLACAGGSTARAVAGAVASAGFRPGLTTAGAWTAAEAATVLDEELRDGRIRLRLGADGDASDLTLEEGRLAAVRPGTRGAGAVADGAEAGERGRTVDEAHPLAGLDAPALAAFGALVAPEEGPSLAPPEPRAAWRRRRRARAGLMAGAAAAVLIAAGWLHLWGLDRELAAVEARRAAVAGAVEEAEAARSAALRLEELLGGIAALPRPGPAWSRVVAEVGRRMPASAHLRVLDAGAEDGVRLAGTARSPSALVPRLEASPLFRDVTLASVSRSAGGSGDGDAFEITLRLSGGGARGAGDAAPDTAAPAAAVDTGDGTDGSAGPTGDGAPDLDPAEAP